MSCAPTTAPSSTVGAELRFSVQCPVTSASHHSNFFLSRAQPQMPGTANAGGCCTHNLRGILQQASRLSMRTGCDFSKTSIREANHVLSLKYVEPARTKLSRMPNGYTGEGDSNPPKLQRASGLGQFNMFTTGPRHVMIRLSRYE
jgi:hypothetical protein